MSERGASESKTQLHLQLLQLMHSAALKDVNWLIYSHSDLPATVLHVETTFLVEPVVSPLDSRGLNRYAGANNVRINDCNRPYYPVSCQP